MISFSLSLHVSITVSKTNTCLQRHSAPMAIRRIHIEEDAGKLIHDKTNGSLLDFNRAGVPLIEIVTEPMLHSSAEAKVFLETLREILIYIEVTDGRMQEGSIRCDVNVSIREKGAAELGIRCEMKNINTFSGAERAIVYEANRQKALILAGGKIEQETRRWDDEAGINYACLLYTSLGKKPAWRI